MNTQDLFDLSDADLLANLKLQTLTEEERATIRYELAAREREHLDACPQDECYYV